MCTNISMVSIRRRVLWLFQESAPDPDPKMREQWGISNWEMSDFCHDPLLQMYSLARVLLRSYERGPAGFVWG